MTLLDTPKKLPIQLKKLPIQLKKLLIQLKKLLIQLIQQIRTYRKWLIIILVFTAVIIVSRPVLWPDGFGIKADKSVTTTVEKDPQGNITKFVETAKTEPGKTLWDWISLLGVPITLAILGYWLQQIQQERAADETREEVLQIYFDRLSVLLVDKNLLAIAAKISKSQVTLDEEELLASAVDVIRARTLSMLRRFENDEEGKTSVIRFLIEADFISKLNINLSGANLSDADLSSADLSGAYLSDADLRGANLIRANLIRANLSGANLSGAKLIRADLSNADLSGADLSGANLFRADLIDADLSSADLSGAYLSGANLNGAKLIRAKLIRANLSFAKLIRANLIRAYLSDADLSLANLSDADLRDAHLSLANKISSERIKSARNWESALYHGKRLDDPEVSKQLGLDASP